MSAPLEPDDEIVEKVGQPGRGGVKGIVWPLWVHGNFHRKAGTQSQQLLSGEVSMEPEGPMPHGG